MMKRIQVPETELSICPIGLGTVNAGLGWSNEEADRIFDAYLASGGNMIDTARVYAGGHSEEVVGNWLKKSGKRNEIVLVTKGGHPKFDSPADDLHISRMTRDDMRTDLETSLRLLRTDCIDLYFYHRDNRAQRVEDEIEVMEEFRREGKIRYYGCSNWDTDRIKAADACCKANGYRGFIADQILYNAGMAHMNPLPDDTLVYLKGDLMEYHRSTPTNLVMPYMGVASGFFHKYAKGGAAAVASSPYATRENLALAEKLVKRASEKQITMTQMVLGFFFTQAFTCTPLYGPKSAAQIEEALNTLEIPFDQEDYQA